MTYRLLPPGIRRKLGFRSASFSMRSRRIPLGLKTIVSGLIYVTKAAASSPVLVCRGEQADQVELELSLLAGSELQDEAVVAVGCVLGRVQLERVLGPGVGDRLGLDLGGGQGLVGDVGHQRGFEVALVCAVRVEAARVRVGLLNVNAPVPRILQAGGLALPALDLG